jgi:aminoglycoside phosphotransferase family enzyme
VVSIVRASTCDYYKIEHLRQTDTSWLMFIRHTVTNKRLVIKLLREYQDDRYSLKTILARQKCQLEALRWNRRFTPKVYFGLARLVDLKLDQKIVGIGEIISHPKQEILDEDVEYVLLMRQLPKSRRLDQLLKAKDRRAVYEHVRLVTAHIAEMHNRLLASPNPVENDAVPRWGSPEQLREKLEENLLFFDRILVEDRHGRYQAYSVLKESLLGVFTQARYAESFMQRLEERRIKRCHGDLKSTNIWITQYYDRRTRRSRRSIKLIDVIDFNASFSNIDILSDFAMFVADIHARTQSEPLVKTMIDDYLDMTLQNNDVARLLLNYYIAEKAMVSAVINILYDSKPELGLSFLELMAFYIQKIQM